VRRYIAVIALTVGLAACNTDAPEQKRQTSAPPLQVRKLSEVVYDRTVYYAHMEFTDATGTYRCFVADNTPHGADAGAGGFGISNCERVGAER
jgi:hypothetical protein